MVDIRTYKTDSNSAVNASDNAYVVSGIKDIVKYLHRIQPQIKMEFESLSVLNERYPNNVFPLKMQALADIYQAADTLYEWYITKAKPQL